MSLTPRQLSILSFIDSFIAEWHRSPSFAEIATGCGLSYNSRGAVHKYVTELTEGGYLRRGRSRYGIEVVKLPNGARPLSAPHTCPSCGCAWAGSEAA